jgi:hypothetical protein
LRKRGTKGGKILEKERSKRQIQRGEARAKQKKRSERQRRREE